MNAHNDSASIDHSKNIDFDYIMKTCLLYGKILQESNATNEMIQINIQKIAEHL